MSHPSTTDEDLLNISELAASMRKEELTFSRSSAMRSLRLRIEQDPDLRARATEALSGAFGVVHARAAAGPRRTRPPVYEVHLAREITRERFLLGLHEGLSVSEAGERAARRTDPEALLTEAKRRLATCAPEHCPDAR